MFYGHQSPSSGSPAYLPEYSQRVLTQDAANLFIGVTAPYQPARDIDEVAAVIKPDQSPLAIHPVFWTKTDGCGVFGAQHGGEHCVGHRPGPVGTDRHMLPTYQTRDVIDVVEHMLDRWNCLFSEEERHCHYTNHPTCISY